MFFWMGLNAGEYDLFDIGLKSFCVSLACFLPSFGLDLASLAGVFFSGCSMPGFASRSPNGGSSTTFEFDSCPLLVDFTKKLTSNHKKTNQPIHL